MTKDTTTIVDGNGESFHYPGPYQWIRAAIGVTTSDYDREAPGAPGPLSGVRSRQSGGPRQKIAMKEQKLRVEDALNATKGRCGRGHRAWRRCGLMSTRSPLWKRLVR